MSNRTVTQLGAIVLMVPLMVLLSAQNQMVKGNTYADTVEVGVRTLTLIGAGLRERGWLDIYTMGAYAENRTCDPQVLISMDGAKSLRIDLLRDVDAKSMAAEIEKALEKNLPPSIRSVSSIRASNLSISGWDGSKLVAINPIAEATDAILDGIGSLPLKLSQNPNTKD